MQICKLPFFCPRAGKESLFGRIRNFCFESSGNRSLDATFISFPSLSLTKHTGEIARYIWCEGGRSSFSNLFEGFPPRSWRENGSSGRGPTFFPPADARLHIKVTFEPAPNSSRRNSLAGVKGRESEREQEWQERRKFKGTSCSPILHALFF